MGSRTPRSFGTGSRDVPAWARSALGRRLAVLGADGFIGSHVVRTALARGGTVTAICIKEPWRLRDLDGHPQLKLEAVPGGRWWAHGYQLKFAGLLDRADVLIMLAYEPPASKADRLQHEFAVNVRGAHSVAETASQSGVPVVFSSSADVYGPRHDDPVTERTPPEPATPYAQAKLEAERALFASGACVALRISTVFGPGENGPRAIPSFVRALSAGEDPVVHGDGTDVRDYVHVGDLAATIVNSCASNMDGRNTLLNIGSGVGRTTNEILSAVADTFGVEPRASYQSRTSRPSRLVLDITQARVLLGLAPRQDFKRALQEEVAWLRRLER